MYAGMACSQIGRYGEALAFFKRALGIAETTEMNGRDVAAIYNNLSTLYRNLGRYEEMLETLHCTLVMLESAPPPNTYLLADIHGNQFLPKAAMALTDVLSE